MSTYQHMDHAAWVEENNRAQNARMAKRNTRTPPKLYPETLTPIQAKAMDILGMVYGGIYNAPIKWEAVEWNYGRGIMVRISHHNSLATFDWGGLTLLVFLAHEARIRVDIRTRGQWGLHIIFYQRKRQADNSAAHHPNLDEAVAKFRAYLPADHRILYREAEPAAAATEAAA